MRVHRRNSEHLSLHTWLHDRAAFVAANSSITIFSRYIVEYTKPQREGQSPMKLQESVVSPQFKEVDSEENLRVLLVFGRILAPISWRK